LLTSMTNTLIGRLSWDERHCRNSIERRRLSFYRVIASGVVDAEAG
jgi:hypothetical protein